MNFREMRLRARQLKTTKEVNDFIEKETGKKIKVKNMNADKIIDDIIKRDK